MAQDIKNIFFLGMSGGIHRITYTTVAHDGNILCLGISAHIQQRAVNTYVAQNTNICIISGGAAHYSVCSIFVSVSMVPSLTLAKKFFQHKNVFSKKFIIRLKNEKV